MGRTTSAGPSHATVDDSFLFGVGDSGFQSEGGYNGHDQPRNNWADWEDRGRAEPAGVANQFWTRYPEHFDRAAEAGCNGFRLGVEWTRCEPADGQIDVGAIEHYRQILSACVDRGLQPVVALHHFTHPAWLGPDFWLSDDAPQRFARWVERIVPELAPHCSRWTTVNEINAYAIGSYLIGYFPPGKRFGRSRAARAMSNMVAAHVLAYDAIHRVQPEAQVSTSTYAFWAYDVDRFPIDLLLSRSEGVDRAGLHDWLAARRAQYGETVLAGLSPWDRHVNAFLHGKLQLFLPDERHWTTALDAIDASPWDRCLDVVQLNYYDPKLSNYARLPGRRANGRRLWMPDPKHWEQRPSPEHLVNYLRACEVPDLPIWIMESGLCNAVVDGRRQPRPDGWTRPRYLRAHLDAVRRALAAGIDVKGYFHWSLFDSYQWGEYESRFGLYGVERHPAGADGRGGECKFLDTDSMGDDAAAAFRSYTSALRAGESSALQ